MTHTIVHTQLFRLGARALLGALGSRVIPV
jgi:hypothetical protein